MRSSSSRRGIEPRSGGRQRGVAAIFLAAALTALMACILLVLDIGNLYAAQRNLEQQATLAALAGAQSLCMAAVTPATSVSNSIISNTQKNQSTPTMGAGGLQTGYVDSSSGSQLFIPKTPPPNVPAAVQVNLTATSPPGLVSALAPRASHTLSATAAASERIYGKYMVGTNLGAIGALPLDLPVALTLSTSASLSPIANVAAFATTLNPPTALDTFVSPPYDATSAQILVQVRANVAVNLNGLVSTSLPIGIDLGIPAATASLTEISCPTINPLDYTAIIMASTSVASVEVGTFSGSASALPVPALTTAAGATLGNLSLLGQPVVTLTQKSGPITLTVDGLPETPMVFDTFASGESTDAVCAGEIYGTGPNADVCYEATAPNNTQTVFASDSTVLATTINSALTTFLGNVQASLLPSVLPALPISLGEIPSQLAGDLAGPLTSVGASVDTVLGPVLEELGTQVGAVTVTFQAVEHGSPISNTFTTVASGS